MIQGYADGLRGVRLSGGKTRYGQWPFEPRLIKEDKIESSGAAKPDPSQLPPPFAGAIDQVSVEVAWQASPEEDNPIGGYELEAHTHPTHPTAPHLAHPLHPPTPPHRT